MLAAFNHQSRTGAGPWPMLAMGSIDLALNHTTRRC